MITRFAVNVEPDWRGLRQCVLREGTAARVHHIELFLDPEIQDAVCERFQLLNGLDPAGRYFEHSKQIRLQSFLGYDYVRWSLERQTWPLHHKAAPDTAALARKSGRNFVDMHRGPITNWEEFEAYPWPDAAAASTEGLEWFEKHLPDNLCVMGSGGFAHFAEHLTWLMGYETCCLALCEQRDLVAAIAVKLIAYYRVFLERLLRFDRVKLIWGSDDMGFHGGPLLPPADLREFVLAGHKVMAQMSHAAGRPYLLHSCGNLDLILDELIDDVRIDARHSFEDAIEPVSAAKKRYGHRIALLGGIDVDFLCRADETAVRRRVRDTLDACLPGGGYCLGTGNSVANYIPLDNYLAMIDEGRKYAV